MSRFEHLTTLTRAAGPAETPQNLVAEAQGEHAIKLDWDAASDVLGGYRLDRSDGDGPFFKIADLAADATTYTDSSRVGEGDPALRNSVGPKPFRLPGATSDMKRNPSIRCLAFRCVEASTGIGAPLAG
ncbi:MAG: hypothetical protein NTW19_10410 [Planctomycetota bacterium]|nr:hypothetical protein [Planctomycetota bacterium]